MSNLEQLNLDHFFDNQSVEWVNLSEVADIQKGKQFNKSDMEKEAEGLYPVINGGKTPSGYAKKYNSEANTITISEGGSSAGFVNFIESKFWLGGHAYSVIPNKYLLEKYNKNFELCNRFLFNILKFYQNDLQGLKHGAAMPNLNKAVLNNVKIPLLDYSVLEKLVIFLDKFSELSLNIQNKIEENLNTRKKQFNYYFDILLSNEFINKLNLKLNGSELYEDLILKDLIKIYTGKPIYNTETGDDYEYNCYGSGGLLKEKSKNFLFDKPTIVMGRTGSLDNIIYVDKPFWAIDSVYYFEQLTDKLNLKFFYYFLKHVDLEKLSFYTTRPTLNHSLLYNINIKLPPLNVQQKIVEMVEELEKVNNALLDLLKEKAELRSKQFPYYREALFNYFKPAE